MRILNMSTPWTIAVDILAWFVIHMGVVLFIVRLPLDRFNPQSRLFKMRSWERKGDIYNRGFRIKRWKSMLPDGAKWLKGRGFPKKELASRDEQYLETFFAETCRAELTHWIIIFFAPLFFLWNKPFVGWIMIGYALIENVPLIMAQRYNRSRLADLCPKIRLRKKSK